MRKDYVSIAEFSEVLIYINRGLKMNVSSLNMSSCFTTDYK